MLKLFARRAAEDSQGFIGGKIVLRRFNPRAGLAEAGLTLPELILLVALCVIVTALAIPGLRWARLSAHERAAENHLLSMAAAEAAWKSEARVDQDADTVGEYGLIGELSGELVPRSGEKKPPPFLAPLFATGGSAGTDGCAIVEGYVYRIYLVAAVAESGQITAGDDKTLGGANSAAGKTLSDVDAIKQQAEKFIVYAWPERVGSTGSLAYAISESGRLLATNMVKKTYSSRGPIGAPNVPAPSAALKGKAFDGLLAGDALGSDGNLWTVINTAPR